jgi:hypothetical protein
MTEPHARNLGVAVGALLASASTLVCCVLPAVLVWVGAGAALAGLVSAVPQLIWFGERKGLVFGLAGAALFGSGVLLWQARRLPCPTELRAAQGCTRLRRASQRLYVMALAAYGIGGTFAFVLPWWISTG